MDELTTLTLNVTAIDHDHPPNTLNHTLAGDHPINATINEATGLITWNTTEMDGPGTYAFNVTVNDGAGGTAHRAYNVTVLEVNSAPVLQEIPDGTAVETYQTTIQATATDPDHPPNTLTYSLDSRTGATINNATGMATWTPAIGQAGSHQITITVSDGAGGTASQNFTIMVGAPVGSYLTAASSAIDGSGGFSKLGGAYGVDTFRVGQHTYAVVTAARDDGIQVVNLTDPHDPDPASTVPDTTSTVLGYPQGVAAFRTYSGTYAIAASATENGIQVVNLTDPARPTPAGSLRDTARTSLSLPLDVAAFHLGTGTYAIVTTPGEGVQLVNVTDPSAPAATASIRSGISSDLVGAQGVAAFQASAGTYAIIGTQSNGVQIIDVTDPARPSPVAAMVDTPQLALANAMMVDTFRTSAGTYAVVVSMDEGVQIIDVTDPANPAPTAALMSDLGTALDSPYAVDAFRIGAHHYAMITSLGHGVQIIDVTDPANPAPAAFMTDDEDTVLINARALSVFRTTTGAYAAVASHGENGIQVIQIGDSVPNGANRPPELDPVPHQTIQEHRRLAINVIAIDLDDPAGGLEYGLAAPNRGASIDPSTGLFVWVPGEVHGPGIHTFNVTVSDGAGESAHRLFNVTVLEVNEPPTMDPPLTLHATELSPLEFTANATDADIPPNNMTYGISGHPAGVALNQATGAFSWTPARGQAGNYTFTITVHDGSGGTASQNVTVLVNTGPQIRLVAVGSATDGQGGFTTLDGAAGVDTFETSTGTYAVVASWGDSALQIINVTDPANPAPASSVRDGGSTLLGGARDVAVFQTGSGTYAITTSYFDHAVQIIDLTDPANPAPVSSVRDGGAVRLRNAAGVDTFETSTGTYAVVAPYNGRTLQIINVTDPANPVPTATVPNGGSDAVLQQVWDVTVFQTGSGTYALVSPWQTAGSHIVDITDPTNPVLVNDTAAITGGRSAAIFEADGRTYAATLPYAQNSLQIVDVTDPANPVLVAAIQDDHTTSLAGAEGVAAFRLGPHAYVVAASGSGDGVQLVDVTDPRNPVATASLPDDGSTLVGDAWDVAIFRVGSDVYAVVASWDEDGVQIVHLGSDG